MSSEEKINYSDTLNLPKTDFSMRGGLSEKEPKILESLEENEIYYKMVEKNKGSGKSFIFHDGPPYANNNIHLGHAFNKIIKDIIIRYKNMAGFYAPFIPGWDTHGLPIEKRVEQITGKRKDEVGIPEFIKRCEDYALKQVNIQMQQFKRLGIMADFKNRYVTLDKDFEVKQINVFYDMYKKGYIYRDLKPVYWCEDCQTALAEAEIEYEEDTATSIFVKFSLNDDKGIFSSFDKSKIYFVIWTTTPWTIPGNQAVTVNPEFEYSLVKVDFKGIEEYYVIATELVDSVMAQANITTYNKVASYMGKDLENIILNHPILDKTSIVILGSDTDLLVTLDAGTGLVHTAPGFGNEDYLVCKKYNIEIVVPVDEQGYMTEEAGSKLKGLKYSKANEEVITILDKSYNLLALTKITHPYPHCWRCHKPIIYRATTQWFASVDKFRNQALGALKTVNWLPKWGYDRMYNMIKDRSDWCISRQRVWGVPIPMFYCSNCNKELINDETIERISKIINDKSSSAWYGFSPQKLLGNIDFTCECGSHELKKETDIMDVWFDSGSSHFAVLEDKKYGLSWPADLYLEGNDQYRGWFQSSLLTSVALRNIAPYKEVVTHGFLTDGEGKKMSKSLGNGIDPLEICNEFGADILRLWTVASDYHTDVRVSKEIITSVAEVYKKLRNTARFILGNLYDFNLDNEYVDFENREEIDKYIMIKLNTLVKEVRKAYDEYDFHTVFMQIHKFCTLDLSAKYLDVVKDRLYTLNQTHILRKSIQSSIYDILYSITRMLAPILAFTSEEIFSYLPKHTADKDVSILLKDMPITSNVYELKELEKKFDKLYELREEILVSLEKARTEKLIGHPLDSKIIIKTSGKDYELYKQYEEILEMICIVSKLKVEEGSNNIKVEKAMGKKCERCWKYTEYIGDNQNICEKCIDSLK